MVLLYLVTDLFGANAGGAVGIETDVGIEIFEERGIVLLEQMDIGEKAVNDGNGGRKKACFFGGREGFGKMFLVKQGASEFVMTQPQIGVERNSFPD